MELRVRESGIGYIDSALWVPKSAVNVEGTKRALTFQIFEQQRVLLLTLYKETDHHLIVPREFWSPKDFSFPVIDLRPTHYTRFNFKSRVLLDHRVENGVLVSTGKTVQTEAMAALLKSRGGILQLACGSGKTVVALDFIARRKVPALIVLDTTQLMKQWTEEIGTCLDVPGGIGLIQAETFDWKKGIVLATYHTLSARAPFITEEVRRWFGLIIWDECFVAGTNVDGHPIETVRQGDMVRSFNHQTQRLEFQRVLHVFESRPSALVRLRLRDGQPFVVTPGHPFYTKRGYVPAKDLQPCDAVATLEHQEGRLLAFVGVDSVAVLEPGRDGTYGGLCPDGHVYNLEVAENNNYFVDNVLVHNCHHVSAPVFSRSADIFYGMRLGLSATPERDDGMHVVHNFHLGPTIYKNLLQDLKPKIYFVWTRMGIDKNDPAVMSRVNDCNGEMHIGRVAAYLGSWRPRVEFVIDQVRQAVGAGRKVIVLSKSVDALINMLTVWNGNAGLVTDIPFPTETDVGENAPPRELTVREIIKLRKTISRAAAALSAMPSRHPERSSMTASLQSAQLLLHQHDVFKKCESLWNKKRDQYLKQLLAQPSTGGLMIYKVDADTRTKMLREKQVTFAIAKYGREGLDNRSLDTIIVNEPLSSRNSLQQLLGRVLRKKEGKKESVAVFLEDDIGPFIGMCRKLRRHLSEWPHEEGGPFVYENVGHITTKRTTQIWTNTSTSRGLG